ncbi:MAG: FKBP-type peptidyl-prolyl cis-trans isomerase 2, partial [Arcticibacterium sp.]
KILEVGETQIKLDANHPLAGKDLTFDLELVSIAPTEEVKIINNEKL